MKVSIDNDKCIGCGICVGICPEVFEMNSEGKAEVKINIDTEKHKDAIKEAAESCPVEAIEIED